MKYLLVLANGHETIEIFTVVDYLRRLGIDVDMASVTGDYKLETSHGISYKADMLIEDIDKDSYEGLYIPGGTEGAESLKDDKRVIDLVRDFDERGKIIAAICAGPIVLDRAGVLKSKRATSYPGVDLEDVLEYVDDEIVVVDKNILTSRGPALTNYLVLKLCEILKGDEAKDKLKEEIQQDKVERYFREKF